MSKSKYHGWSDAQKAYADKLLEEADGIKNYRAAANFFPEWKQHSERLAQSGGLSREMATDLARYRMYKNGATEIPEGPPTPLPSTEESAARGQQFMTADHDTRKQMWDEDKARTDRSAELFYDNIAAPPAPPPQQAPAVPPMLAREEQPLSPMASQPAAPQAMASSAPSSAPTQSPEG